MNLKPLVDRIVVRRAESEDKTKGGILLPDSAENKPQKGKGLPWASAACSRTVSVSRCRSRKATPCCSPPWLATSSRNGAQTQPNQ